MQNCFLLSHLLESSINSLHSDDMQCFPRCRAPRPNDSRPVKSAAECYLELLIANECS